ncbi:MAG: hypothetical protein EBR82_58310 [Caulobacteraceae bacterium]|nr:hypothetical protein [Caulobacteraceae bacterium]
MVILKKNTGLFWILLTMNMIVDLACKKYLELFGLKMGLGLIDGNMMDQKAGNTILYHKSLII